MYLLKRNVPIETSIDHLKAHRIYKQDFDTKWKKKVVVIMNKYICGSDLQFPLNGIGSVVVHIGVGLVAFL